MPARADCAAMSSRDAAAALAMLATSSSNAIRPVLKAAPYRKPGVASCLRGEKHATERSGFDPGASDRSNSPFADIRTLINELRFLVVPSPNNLRPRSLQVAA